MFFDNAYNIEPTFPSDMSALLANFFNGCAYFHLLESSNYSSFRLIIWAYFKHYPIAQKNANIMKAHFAAQMSK
ncbi:MAG: hypothetical protein G01um101470_655 [Parcubacteria group bacterium Gr01-1014_70]|nr:MAG: hypothetical protein G01um101470_655 [Parcubacteria group bacterium Gr01-1014_70]